MIKQLGPVAVPTDFAEWCHPYLHLIDPRMTDSSEETYSIEEWAKMESDGGVSIKAITYSVEDVSEAIGNDDLEDWTGWKPEPPSPEHFLICAFSTEYDVIVLWWAKKLAQVNSNDS
ncbi:hypothetical protein QK338_05355 [Acinetobacter ursingii]|uniref:hypothetical protein n=1 Tax=Acinetobacter ursingii TaxID=108980 RepID=UPI00249AED75|nr:hypothetical protein [Acinetobacter ursingii]MDI3237543.1 hypothetical protein [Acinetobacter ursingii]